jgi:hypothetical protein
MVTKTTLLNCFFALAGSSLTKMTVMWQNTTVVMNNPSHGTKSLPLKTSCKATKTTLLNFFFALAGSSLTKMTVMWQNTTVVTNKKPTAEDKLQGDKDDFIEFFLRPRGQQLDKDDGHMAEHDCRDE